MEEYQIGKDYAALKGQLAQAVALFDKRFTQIENKLKILEDKVNNLVNKEIEVKTE